MTAPSLADKKRVRVNVDFREGAEIPQLQNCITDAVKTAIACLQLFDSEGEFKLSLPDYYEPSQPATNVRVAHVHAALEARRILAEALAIN